MQTMKEGKKNYFAECLQLFLQADLKTVLVMGEKFKLFLLLLLTVCSAPKI